MDRNLKCDMEKETYQVQNAFILTHLIKTAEEDIQRGAVESIGEVFTDLKRNLEENIFPEDRD
jgi:hypothetical protein